MAASQQSPRVTCCHPSPASTRCSGEYQKQRTGLRPFSYLCLHKIQPSLQPAQGSAQDTPWGQSFRCEKGSPSPKSHKKIFLSFFHFLPAWGTRDPCLVAKVTARGLFRRGEERAVCVKGLLRLMVVTVVCHQSWSLAWLLLVWPWFPATGGVNSGLLGRKHPHQ